jgi:NAD(P)-dependent dehydrogenase (short-subunit alcohol dehydrogenase family)
MPFDGRRILVTGASKGIGYAVAAELAERGARVFALSRSATSAAHGNIEPVGVDLADTAALEAAVSARLPLDGLVNCAGVVEVEPFLEAGMANLRTTMDVNFAAPFRLGQLVAGDCVDRGRGASIVNVSSIAAEVGTPGHAVYCASKAALDSLTRVMAVELGPYGIRTNTVNPVVTWTPMAQKAWSDPDKAAAMKARIPMGRFAEPHEVAAAVRYLLSEQASMVNGVSLPVDGGFTAG